MKQILIADDDKDLVQILSMRCRSIGLDVVTAYDARSALAAVLKHNPDLICLDVEMPAGNGLSVCEVLSKDEEYSATPVIILTGRTDPETIRRCGDMCAYYVNKTTNIWARIRPVIYELIDVDAPDPANVSVSRDR
ncbi:MAG: response regulator [Planctomycetales bacterium]|nr:response regulator [Planctomycetales bacterium]